MNNHSPKYQIYRSINSEWICPTIDEHLADKLLIPRPETPQEQPQPVLKSKTSHAEYPS